MICTTQLPLFLLSGHSVDVVSQWKIIPQSLNPEQAFKGSDQGN